MFNPDLLLWICYISTSKKRTSDYDVAKDYTNMIIYKEVASVGTTYV